ncbi:efflux transporter outer membrane subunit [Silvibacterium dinghuense]|uniref:Efflux transporter outer membrane subunit n=1 Tax=Silvibacterium dinghuense TaxID=1560006 RepID=A0A4Q1SJS0_9BACT|nr:efflux transporter outer membrane subunit [Silvibacterium dinghuense]RXS97530.1 efflux transporter outer membrane subunit [Silvibacterium dinghuense]GGG99762.1 outer membrane efflux lipoprotein [Silvibacterium dinghuense]
MRISTSLHPRSLLAAASLALAALAGCTVGPNYQRPATPPAPAAYKETPPPNPPGGDWKQAAPSDAIARGKWWEIYGDTQLNGLEEKVAVSNQTLKAAYEQYQQAREQVRVARAAYYPTLSAGPSVSRTRESYHTPNTQPGTTNYQYNTLAIEGQASWEPDLWGQVRRTVEEQRANAQASAADLANTELSLRSELATDYFELRGLDSQKRLLDNTVSTDTDYLHLTQVRFKGGVATDVDVAQAQTQLDTVKAQDIDIGVARSQYEHAIATLVGVSASNFSLPFSPLDLTLPVIPPGVPSELLERRPDISAAERRTDSANAQIGIAISAYYPTIQLGGTGGFESTRPGNWLQGPSALWSLGGSATELLFDAGRRHALTNQARDAYEQQTANYRQTVLTAFQEVEDNLAALRVLNDESNAQARAVDSARHSLALSTNRYKGGVTTYLEVLTAQTTQLSNERTQADIVTRQFTASVGLIKAIGGGWNTSQLPSF